MTGLLIKITEIRRVAKLCNLILFRHIQKYNFSLIISCCRCKNFVEMWGTLLPVF